MRCLSVKCEFHNGMKYEVMRKDSRCLSLLTQSPSSVVCFAFTCCLEGGLTNNCGQWPTRTGSPIWVGDLRDLSRWPLTWGWVLPSFQCPYWLPCPPSRRGTSPQKLGHLIIFFLDTYDNFAFSNILKINSPKSKEKLNFGGRWVWVPTAHESSPKQNFVSTPLLTILF